jgi:hypothetical protein
MAYEEGWQALVFNIIPIILTLFITVPGLRDGTLQRIHVTIVDI